MLSPRIRHGDIALLCHQALPLFAQKPTVKDGGGGVGRQICCYNDIVGIQEGVGAVADGRVVRLHTADCQQLETVGHFHVVCIVIDGVADGGSRIVIGGNGLYQVAHLPRT